MVFFAVSPWSIQLSRVAYEANVGLLFVLIGSWLFIRGINRRKWNYLYVSTIPLTLSAVTYHSEKIFTPLLFIGLLMYGSKLLLSNKRHTAILIVMFILLNSIWILDSRTTARGRSVTIFANQTQVLAPSIQQIEYDNQNDIILGSLIHNRRIIYGLYYARNYLSHFNPVYLFLTGDQERHHAPGMGLLYVVSIPFIIVGIAKLNSLGKKSELFIYYWLLIAPLASSVAFDSPNSSRNFVGMPMWHIFGAVGLCSVLIFCKSRIRPAMF